MQRLPQVELKSGRTPYHIKARLLEAKNAVFKKSCVQPVAVSETLLKLDTELEVRLSCVVISNRVDRKLNRLGQVDEAIGG